MSEVKVNKISPRTNCGTVTVGDSGDSVSVTAGVPVTVNGDLKSNALKAVDGGSIISQCGTNITLGASGDTINLAAGASQTGFGRTGTVDWDTTAKTASFTAVSGNGYFVDTSSSAITLTLPASPSAGDIVSFKDYAYTFATNNLTVARNGSPIGGANTDNIAYSVNGTSKTFIYVDGTQGWLVTNASTDTSIGENPAFVTATGGTITTCGNFKIHTFTGPGTFTVSCAGNSVGSNTVSYVVVAGGGGGGGDGAGGGGAGGYREGKASSDCYTASPLNAPAGLPVTVQGYPIAVGGGGAGGPGSPGNNGVNGVNSTFSTITSAGGGGGGPGGASGTGTGLNGGSGGGGGRSAPGSAGSGNTPPVSPPQGANGGANGAGCGGAGGGGATNNGANNNGTDGGVGGTGATSSINATPTARAGGGGGGSVPNTSTPPVSGGAGGGGAGAGTDSVNGTAGTTNTGGGGGGGSASGNGSGAAGGSGIVIIRYKYQ